MKKKFLLEAKYEFRSFFNADTTQTSTRNTYSEDFLKTTHCLKNETGAPLRNQEANSPHQILLTSRFVCRLSSKSYLHYLPSYPKTPYLIFYIFFFLLYLSLYYIFLTY
jgi:hypothetical protein